MLSRMTEQQALRYSVSSVLSKSSCTKFGLKAAINLGQKPLCLFLAHPPPPKKKKKKKKIAHLFTLTIRLLKRICVNIHPDSRKCLLLAKFIIFSLLWWLQYWLHSLPLFYKSLLIEWYKKDTFYLGYRSFLHLGLVIFYFSLAIRDKYFMLITRVKWLSRRVSRENLQIMRQEDIWLFKIIICYSMDWNNILLKHHF